jgi:hypothetical protein
VARIYDVAFDLENKVLVAAAAAWYGATEGADGMCGSTGRTRWDLRGIKVTGPALGDAAALELRPHCAQLLQRDAAFLGLLEGAAAAHRGQLADRSRRGLLSPSK